MINYRGDSIRIPAEGPAEEAPERGALEPQVVRMRRVQEEAAPSAVVARSQADAHQREAVRVLDLQEEVPTAEQPEGAHDRSHRGLAVPV